MSNPTRRTFLDVTGKTLAGGLLYNGLTRSSFASEKDKSSKPNMLVILVDDLGYGDLSSYGAEDMETPHIDSLAASGMRFTHAYANCPVCSPTRAALLSGRYQEMVGVPGVIRTHPNNSWGHLTPDSILLPSLLQKAGYQTAIIGKWHLGLESPNIPNERGFDFFHGFLGDMMDDYYNHRRHGINYMRRNKKEIDPKGHATDLFTEWACDYLKEQTSDQPFFLYLAYNAPHTPIQPPKEWVEKVKKRELGIDDKRAELVAFIEHLDHGIGKVLSTLEETGLDKNTIVVFTSDNGGLDRVGANNGPLREGKGTLYEGGIRVPMAVRWPGHVYAGSETDQIMLSMDILPTLFDAVDVDINHTIDGMSFLPTILGKKQPRPDRDLFFGRREGGGFFQGKRIEAIRRGDWKLLRPKPGAPFELYNLKEDPLEQHDLADEQKEITNKLKRAMQAQLDKYSKIPWQPKGTD